MGQRSNGLEVLLLLLCGCASTVYLEGQGHNNEVTSFNIPSARTATDFRLSNVDSSASGADSQQLGRQKGNPSSLPVFQLCHPQGRHFAGFEGLTPQGLVLDKVYVLVVSASSPAHHLPLPGLPTPRCRSFHQVSKASTSEKVRSYPQLVRDYKQLRRSKSGLGVFDMLPSDGGCSVENVAPSVLSRMIQLGEFLSRRYQQAWPWLTERGRDPVVAGSVPESESFQSVSAVLHGLLQEKQFCRLEVRKLQRDVVRGLDTHQPCPALAEVELFLEQAYRQETAVFKSKEPRAAQGPQALYASLGLGRTSAAKDVAKSLHHQVCGVDGDLCAEGRCFNLTEDSVGQLWEVTAQHNAYLSSSSLFQSYAVADTSRHLDTLLAWFSQPPVADQVIRVDMADDYFFLKLLSALGHRLQKPILPTSRLVVEQFRKSQASGPARFWRVLVDGEVVTDGLLACAGGAARGLCGVDSLKALRQHWAHDNMFRACFQPRDEL